MAPSRQAIHRRTAVLEGHLRAVSEEQGLQKGYEEGRIRLRAANSNGEAKGGNEEVDSKIITPSQAAALISDGVTITIGGFVGCGCPEVLLNAIRSRFDNTQHPQGLELVYGISVGDKKGRGTDVLAQEGLVRSLIYGWTGSAPKMLQLVNANKVTAWNLPFGAISHLFRDIASSKPGPIMRIGLGTFVDPREKGGKLNSVTTADRVELVTLGGTEYLWYKAFPIHVALLRGTTADPQGNISMEHEALYYDNLNQAMAAKNSGGLVIVQVERVAESLAPRSVHIPSVLVDYVVVSPPSTHVQSYADHSTVHNPYLSGELQQPMSALTQLASGEKKIMAHRAMFEIKQPNILINLGVGTPEGVSIMAKTHAHQNPMARSAVLSTEAGSIGGTPGGGLLFGAAFNATATLPSASILDFYQGGSIGLACLGAAEVDRAGNVNVSNFGNGRMPGCGGFIDISQTAQQVVFMGTLTSGGLKTRVQDGKLVIEREGKQKKFVRVVNEKTFAATQAGDRPILYLTERCVFCLKPQGLELIEIAPGMDLERDIIANMEFRPLIPTNGPALMDARIFEG